MSSSGKRSKATPRFQVPFHHIGQFAGWVPASFVGIGPRKFNASRRFPVLTVQSEAHAREICKTLNRRCDNPVLSGRFAPLLAQAFPLNERLDIEASIRKAQAGELTGKAAKQVHLVAREAAVVAESLEKMIERGDAPELGSGQSRAGTCYIFVRWFLGLREPCPLERYVLLPDAEVEAAIEADARKWWKKNGPKVVERLKAQMRRILGTPNAESGSTDDEHAKCLKAIQQLPKGHTVDQLFAVLESHFPTQLGVLLNPTPAEPKPEDPPARRPCYDRDHLFLQWYETEDADTYHSHAGIRDRWNKMPKEERTEICPQNPNRVNRDVAISAVKAAKRDAAERRAT